MAAVKNTLNNDIRRAGMSTIAALEAIGLQGCFVGGYAYSLLGIQRAVNVCVALRYPSLEQHMTSIRLD